MNATSREPLLSVRDLHVAFESQSGSREVLHSVTSVSYTHLTLPTKRIV